MTSHIALLRGINVGGNNKFPMKDLARIFSEAGCTDVKTYIQSGNVVFKADDSLLMDLSERLAGSIAQYFGRPIPVVFRRSDELAAVVENNPFLASGADSDALHVMFLAEQPNAQAIAKLDPGRSPNDSYTVIGREIFLHCPNGLAQTKLSNAYFDSKLDTTSTCRNWRTVMKLLELSQA